MRLRLRSLAKSYFLGGHEIPVLKGIDLDVATGELVSITGTSGVGKSTLLHVIGTLDEPSAGTIRYDDVDIFAQSAAAVSEFRNHHIGFVFQFHHLLPEFTALENAVMPALVRRESTSAAMARARRLLDEVGLSHRLDHRPGELSGGEQQRVALARALVNEPSLLLADEPTGNLDEQTGEGIHEIIAQLNAERRITVIVVTHNPRLAARMPRRIRLHKEGVREADDVERPPVPTPVPPSTPAAPHTADAIDG